MPIWLEPHPNAARPAGLRLRVGVSRASRNQLIVHHRIYGTIDQLTWHDVDREGRHDELWRHGCFEAFVRGAGQSGYIELNFAPTRRWAAYQFDSYREGMRPADVSVVRQDWVDRSYLSVPRLEMQVLVEMPASMEAVDWELGLTAILETTDGMKSYWALAHPPGKPDFHDPSCFVARLPAPSAP